MTATVDVQATATVRAACPHDCPDTCAMLVTVRRARRSRCGATRTIRSPAAGCA